MGGYTQFAGADFETLNPDYTRVNDIPLDGYAYNLQVNKNTGKIFATIDDGTDTPTAVSIFDINNGKELMKIKSASCPSVSDDGSIFVFRNDETEEAVVSVVDQNGLQQPFFYPALLFRVMVKFLFMIMQ